MRKKIVLLLIFIVSFMGFSLNASADVRRSSNPICATKGKNVDYSLNYDVEDFKIVNGNLYISGWVVRHNCDNYGGINLDVSFRLVSSDGKVVGIDSSGNILDDFKVNFVSRDLTYDYCYRNVNNDTCTGEYLDYNNVGFNINLPLEKYLSQLSNNEWSLKIHYKFYYFDSKNQKIPIEGDENLAVYTTKVDSTSFKNASFKLFGVGDKVDIIGNHVNYTKEKVYYWKLAKGYVVSKRVEGTNGSPSTYTLKNAGASAALDYGFNNCGFDYANQIGLTEKKCIGPGTAVDTSISSIFVKASGAVKIKYVGSNDHICNVSSGTIDACTGGSIENNCSKMTVYTSVNGQNISAVVNINESSTISPGEGIDYVDDYNSYFGIDYSKYNIVKGKTFHYALTYTNTASWSIVERNYGSVSVNTGDAAIREKMKSYYTEIGSNFVANVSIKSNDSEKFDTAGSWTCTGGTKEEFASGNTTLTCKYELKYLYIDGSGKDSYVEEKIVNNGVELTLGRNFYIPLSYDKDKFTWEVSSSSELTTVKVRTNKENRNVTDYLLKTGINSNSNKCYINVVGPNYNPNTSGDSSGDPGNEYVSDKLYVYRSVSISNPFPDGNIPENWNNVNLINRLKNSYQNINNPDYETVPLTASVVKQIRSLDTIYTKWDDTVTSSANNSGNNNFVRNANYFNIIKGKHCKFGLYKPECDERVR